MELLEVSDKLHRKKVRILLVQITNKNLGDSVIADNTRFLLKRASRCSLWKKYEILDYAINTEDLLQIQYADAIVFAGGGLIKFRQENLYKQVSEIIMEAQKYGVPVFLNSVGVEGYDAKDARCFQLVEAINQPCVKMITVRDDIECLKKHYIRNEQIRIREVYDPAICSKETYKLKKCHENSFIGLGIARESLYEDYGIPLINRSYLIDFWKKVIALLEEKGYQWRIFTNGLDKDEAFAQTILEEVGHGTKLQQPFDALELVTQISQMQGMIACRMHSNIIAYALQIPSVGLVWNEKMTFWGEKCGYPERYIPYTQLKPQKVVDALEAALKRGSKKPSWINQYRIYQEIRLFVHKYGKPRQKQVPQLNVDKHLVATALGGYEYRYKNLNSIPQLYQSIKKGYCYVEVDVRMAADGRLVCVNGWGAATKKALGIPNSEVVLSTEDFKNATYYNHFPTCTFDQFAEVFSKLTKKNNVKAILDVGKPKPDNLDEFYEKLVIVLKKYMIAENKIVVRLQRERDIKAFAKQYYTCKKCYFISDDAAVQEEKYNKIIQFCKKNKIRMISMNDHTWNVRLQQLLSGEGMQTLILSYNKVGDVITALQNGADLVASHYYGVDYLDKLL